MCVEEGGRRLERREKASRQMLNGACKYRERRDTKGAPKRSGVRVGRKGDGGKRRRRRKGGGVVRGRFIVCRARRTARGVPFRKRRTGKGVGGSTKGCFNRLLSSVARSRKKKK